jgi:hypothetical protein
MDQNYSKNAPYKRTFRCFGDTVSVASFLSLQHLIKVPFVFDALELLLSLCKDFFSLYFGHFQKPIKRLAGPWTQGKNVAMYRWRSSSSMYLLSSG